MDKKLVIIIAIVILLEGIAALIVIPRFLAVKENPTFGEYVTVSVCNKTGEDISGFQVRNIDSKFSKNKVQGLFRENETRDYIRDIYGEKYKAYEVKLTMDNGDSYILHSFPMEDGIKVKLCKEDDVVFVKYKVSESVSINTKAEEASYGRE